MTGTSALAAPELQLTDADSNALVQGGSCQTLSIAQLWVFVVLWVLAHLWSYNQI